MVASLGSGGSRGEEDAAISASATAAEGRFRDIVDLLVAAGYFRARITGISPFDKVIGGLTWCITASDVDVDVDVLFTEDSTIGAKIKLGEAIVKALRLMRCAYPLQSHQIRGLDYDAIFPVIQWLVRKVMETREERAETIRSFSESQFHKHGYALSEDRKLASRRTDADEYVRGVLHKYRPVRRYRAAARDGDGASAASSGASSEDGLQRVRETLLEYGGRVKVLAEPEAGSAGAGGGGGGGGDGGGAGGAAGGAASSLTAADSESAANAARLLAQGGDLMDATATPEGRREAKDREREAKAAAEEAKAMEELLAQMDSLGDRAKRNALSASGVGEVVGRNAKAIRQMNEERAELQKQLEAIMSSGESGGAMRREAHRRQLASLEKQIATLEEMGSRTDGELADATRDRDTARKAAGKATAYNERVVRETDKLAFEETPENVRDLKMLTGLVMGIERLKEQEAQFRGQCKRQLGEWKALMVKLEAEGGGDRGDTEEERRLAEIEATHEADLAKHTKIRALLAAKNRELALLERKIDDIPTRTELIQYERRFVELYEQVAGKTEETKKYYNTYNTLCDTKTFLTKETTILNSICENITGLPSKKGAADKLLQSIDDILTSVRDNLGRIKDKASGEKESNVALHEKLSELLERQRAYYKAVSLFKEACFTNEKLLAELGE